MVQTKQGANNNAWIDFMRKCATEYKETQRKEKESSAAAEKPTQRRITRKTPDPEKSKPMTKKDHKQVEKVVKDAGKARETKAKAKAKADAKK